MIGPTRLTWNGDKISASLRSASARAAKEMGKALKKDVQEGIKSGPKTGQLYRVSSKLHKISDGSGALNRHGKKLRTGGLAVKPRRGQQRAAMARLANMHRASAGSVGSTRGIEYPANRLGKLLHSISYRVQQMRAGDWRALVYSRVAYARHLEEGTRKMGKRKLFRDTLKANDRRYREIARNILKRGLR